MLALKLTENNFPELALHMPSEGAGLSSAHVGFSFLRRRELDLTCSDSALPLTALRP